MAKTPPRDRTRVQRRQRRSGDGEGGDVSVPRGEGRRLSRGQLISVVVAAVVALAGAVLWGVGALAEGSAPQDAGERAESPAVEGDDRSTALGPEQGFLPGEPRADGPPPQEPPAGEPAEEGLMDSVSPAVFRLGFSFLVGFAIAYALRTFVRIAMVAIGLLVLALFALQYFGVVDVNWAAMEEPFERGRDWLAANTRTFGDFITGQLPSAALAIAGFAVGLKRRI